MEIKNKEKKQKKTNKKLFFVIFPIVLIGIFFILTPIFFTHIANAGFFSWLTDTVYTAIGKVCWAISYVISYIGGVAIAVETWLIGAILNINATVFDTAIVQMGFSVSLSFANLGFIIGIIVIAIATIIQNQTYGMKQILWKLVFMAILVNFGLVIMGAIFNASNQFTNYFLQCIDPAGGGCSGNESGFTSSNNFAVNLAGAFNPQRSFLINNIESNDTKDIPGATGSGLAQMLVPITSMAFVITAVILIVITLAVFAIMLMIRYVYIAILAILLPFAWMLWVFPSTKSNFSSWWKKFIQWTIFAPIVLFFLWLAMETAKGLSSNSTGTQNFAVYTSTSNPVWAPVAKFFTNFFSPIIQGLLNETVLLGLIIGGMIAANELSITGAKETLGAMKNIGNAAKGYAVKGMKKGANTAIHKNVSVPFTGGKKKFNIAGGINKMQTSKNPLVSAVGRGLNQQNNIGKGLVDEAVKKANGMNSETIAEQLQGSMGKEQQLAYIKTLADRGELDKVKTVGNKSLSDYLESNPDMLNRYGQQGIAKAYDTETLSNSATREAQKAINNGNGNEPITINGIGYASAKEALKENSDELIGGLKTQDINKINTKMAFDGKDPERETAIMDSMARTNPGLVNTITRGMNGAQKKDFSNKYGNMLNQKISQLEVIEKQQIDAIDLEIETKKKNVETIKNNLEASKKIISDQTRTNQLENDLNKETQELNGKMKVKIELNKKYNEDFDGPSGDYKKALKQFKGNMSYQAFMDSFDNNKKE
jgi:hypothetical protein